MEMLKALTGDLLVRRLVWLEVSKVDIGNVQRMRRGLPEPWFGSAQGGELYDFMGLTHKAEGWKFLSTESQVNIHEIQSRMHSHFENGRSEPQCSSSASIFRVLRPGFCQESRVFTRCLRLGFAQLINHELLFR